MHPRHAPGWLALPLAVLCAACSPSGPATADPAMTHIETPLATLDAQFALDRGTQMLAVAYTVHNTGTQVLMLLDGGTSAGGRIEPEALPARHVEGGDVTFSRQALPLPHPTPTVPRMALARKLAAGASGDASFRVELPAGTRRARFCLGVAPWSDDAFTPLPGHADRWQASFRLADTQSRLCTPWFAVAGGRFAAPEAGHD